MTARSSSRYRTILTFSVSTFSLLVALEREFSCHEDVITGANLNDELFILVVECPDTAAAVWEVRVTVLTFDPDATIRRQMSTPGGTSDRPAA